MTPYMDRWRGAVVFIFTVLFTYVWWGADHSRSDWISMFFVLIVSVSLNVRIRGRRGAQSRWRIPAEST